MCLMCAPLRVDEQDPAARALAVARFDSPLLWLRTNGVNTNGAAAEVIFFDRLGAKGTPWHFWEDKSRLTGVPKKSLCQKT